MDAPFVKTSTHPTGRLRLRKELVLLRQAQHPAVVQVSNFVDNDDQTRLEFVRGGSGTIAESPPELPELALAFIAATAGAVGDLHEIGLAHRRLTGDHIIVTPEGHPLLCGFADATMPASAEDRAGDQRSLGALVNLLAQSASSVGRHARAAKALRVLAVEIAEGDGSMTAVALATRAAKLAGRYPVGSSSPGRDRARSIQQRFVAGAGRVFSKPRAVKPVGAGLIAVALTVIGIVGFAGAPGSAKRDATADETAGVAGSSLPTTLGNGVADTSRSPNPPTSSRPFPFTGPILDLDARDHAVQFQAGGATFAAGEVGDEVHVGDWMCTGQPAAVLWRPGTGDVYVFAALPGPGVEAIGVLATSAPGGSLIVPDLDAPCPPLAVRDKNGTMRTVELP